MAITVTQEQLQLNKYDYTPIRDAGDSEYTGTLDRTRVDKNEIYEVIYFIQTIVNRNNLETTSDVRKIEDLLHKTALRKVVMRDELIEIIEKRL